MASLFAKLLLHTNRYGLCKRRSLISATPQGATLETGGRSEVSGFLSHVVQLALPSFLPSILPSLSRPFCPAGEFSKLRTASVKLYSLSCSPSPPPPFSLSLHPRPYVRVSLLHFPPLRRHVCVCVCVCPLPLIRG